MTKYALAQFDTTLNRTSNRPRENLLDVILCGLLLFIVPLTAQHLGFSTRDHDLGSARTGIGFGVGGAIASDVELRWWGGGSKSVMEDIRKGEEIGREGMGWGDGGLTLITSGRQKMIQHG